MIYRKLRKSNLQVSCIGLGTWAIGSGSDWGQSDETESIKAIHASVERGVNLIDTAPCYNFGHSEEVVGKAIKGIRDKVIISTKCGVWWQSDVGNPFYEIDNVTMHRSLKPETIRQEIESSLQRLKTDYIDIYHTHWPDPSTPIDETVDCLLSLQKEGKIRYIAVSNCYHKEYKDYESICNIVDHQIKYSMLDRKIEKEILTDCIGLNVGVLAYSSLEQGALSGKCKDKKRFGREDIRNSNAWFKDNKRQIIDCVMKLLKPYAEKYQCTIAQLVIAWTLSRTGITSVLCGARVQADAIENAGAVDIKITSEDLEYITNQTELKSLVKNAYR